MFGSLKSTESEKLDRKFSGSGSVHSVPWSPFDFLGFFALRAINFPNSRNHSTKLATTTHSSQSPRLKPTVENALCRKGTYTTVICRTIERPSAPHTHPLQNSP